MRYCKACNEPVSWSEHGCRQCGDQSPLGLRLDEKLAIAVFVGLPIVLIAFAYAILKREFHLLW